jgi:hypothetical protein
MAVRCRYGISVSKSGNGQRIYGDGHRHNGVPQKIIAVDTAGGREYIHHLLPTDYERTSNKLDHGCKNHYDTSELV